MTNGWTGGQYSVFRGLLGAYLVVHFIHLVPWGAEVFSNVGMLPDAAASPLFPLFPNLLFVWDAPAAVTALLALGVVASAALTLGFRDRVAALLVWYVWACLFTRNPLISNPGLPFIGWLLLAHACLPTRPFGSWDARGRIDPDAGWRLPRAIYTAAWIVMALGYSYSGATKLASPSWIDGSALAHVLTNPLARPTPLRELILALPTAITSIGTWGALAAELLFAPLALVRRLRPWLWLMLLGMHLGLMTLIDFADLSAGMVLLHLFTFDPAWVPRPSAGRALIFYDGACGLCHRTVRFLLAEDSQGTRFRFAPLESEAFEAARATPGSGFEAGEALPDAVVVRAPDGRLLTRAEAVLEIGIRLGGLWGLLAWIVGWVPLAALDAAYDVVARTRHRLFARPDSTCPILPPHLRERFRT